MYKAYSPTQKVKYSNSRAFGPKPPNPKPPNPKHREVFTQQVLARLVHEAALPMPRLRNRMKDEGNLTNAGPTSQTLHYDMV